MGRSGVPPLPGHRAERCRRVSVKNLSIPNELLTSRGWTPQAVERLGLRFEDGQVLFPVRDQTGELLSFLRWRPGRDPMAEPGSTRELFPPPEMIGPEEENGWLWLVEGEKDCVRAWSLGLAAVAVPGAQNWRTEWAARFTKRRVAVCFDADEAGRQAAARAAADLSANGIDARLVDLAPDRADGFDLTDATATARTEAEREGARGWLTDTAEHLPPEVTPNRHPWLLDAADLLAEPDPGPTPFLVEGLVVQQAIVAMVGRWKTTKSYGLLYLLMCVALGEPAWGLATPENGVPVVYVCEESGRAALWRRLDALCRGHAIDPERLRERLYVAANQRARLDDDHWQAELMAIGREVRPAMFAFDPLARMKAPAREENAQKEMAVVIEFLRQLRDETGAGVGFVHHTGHQGEHMRGSSDLESVWESRLTWKRDGTSPEIALASEHREVEAGPPLTYRISWDHETRSMRFPLVEGDIVAKVRAYLADHPEASANEVADAVRGTRSKVLEAVKTVRDEGGTAEPYQPRTTDPGAPERGGTASPSFREGRTTAATPTPEGGTGDPYHPPERDPDCLDDEVPF
jgi:AAA domain-containing protein/Toprim domain-containing protein